MRIRTEEVTWQEIDGELVILDLQTSAYLTTNVAGAILARRLVDECSLEDLAGVLISEFGIDGETARADARSFVDQLREKELLA